MRKYVERKMSVISQVFNKNKSNSMAIDRIFKENMVNLSHIYPVFLSCKGLFLLDILLNLAITSFSMINGVVSLRIYVYFTFKS